MSFLGSNYLKFLILIWVLVTYCEAFSLSNYLLRRENLIEEEKKEAFGGSLVLKGDEIRANECLMAAKRKEVDEAFEHPLRFLPAKNFLDVRDNITRSEVFQIIRKMPKGALFHAHVSSIASLDFMITNITYEPNLYICLQNKMLQFKFFDLPDQSCSWKSIADLRKTDDSVDQMLREYMILLESEFSDLNDVWDKFESIFDVISGLTRYRPIFEKYFYGAMQELYDDNVMIMEIRSSLSSLYELNGTTYDLIDVARIYQEVADRFIKDHPGFMGVKVIYSPYRKVSQEQFLKYMEKYRSVKAVYPDFIIGFDLVGQEDKGYTLLNFAEKLQELSKEAKFFFHAGETNWYGHSTDQNLFDAVLLNTTRIGHGFALLKHPKLMEIVKKKHIAIELNPISNQVLKLVKDMRNHPASHFFAENLPVVVSSDDPSFWGAAGLSYDFYETFIGIMSRDADLRALKQLAINSITYSGLNSQEQLRALNIFQRDWEKFVTELAAKPNCGVS